MIYDIAKRIAFRTINRICYGDWNFFTSIGIELGQACNRRCHYCPQSVSPMKQRIISRDVWNKFLDRVEEIDYRGMIGFHHYCEPTLIPNFVDYIIELKRRSPRCLPVVFSNGDKPWVLAELMETGLVFRCHVTQHPPTSKDWEKPIEQLRRKYGWRFNVRRITNPHNQAGNVKTVVSEPISKCVDPPGALTLDIDGNHVICCMDYYHTTKFGNIFDQTLKQMWERRDAIDARRLLAAGIPATNLCKGCFSSK